MSKLSSSTVVLSLCVFCAAITMASPAQTLTTLVNFDGTNGFDPASLTQGTDGNFYGTTNSGGNLTCFFPFGCGTVFKITSGGALTTLHSFDDADGHQPQGTLVQVSGNFYGTTVQGGAFFENGGTIFEITPIGAFTSLFSFCFSLAACTGAFPFDGLLPTTNGSVAGTIFYGTTQSGGANYTGTIFSFTTIPASTVTTLYNFCSQTNCTDGAYPTAPVIQGTDGNLYGTTFVGGANTSSVFCKPFPSGIGGCGTIFKFNPSTSTLITLYNFCSQTNCTDGAAPDISAKLIQTRDGNFYGVTNYGGANGSGTVFKFNPSTGTLTTLHSFCSQTNCTDGSIPLTLLQATDGNFYGTTAHYGAVPMGGTIFKITPTGTLTTLHSFCSQTNCTDGYSPSGLLQATDGNFYGVANGGANGDGMVFKLTFQTPPQATQAIINSVNALLSQGVLNGGQDNSLVKELQQAIKLINAGKKAGAIGNLDSFISEVNDLLSSGVLSPSQAEPLISGAESVIAQLS